MFITSCFYHLSGKITGMKQTQQYQHESWGAVLSSVAHMSHSEEDDAQLSEVIYFNTRTDR